MSHDLRRVSEDGDVAMVLQGYERGSWVTSIARSPLCIQTLSGSSRTSFPTATPGSSERFDTFRGTVHEPSRQ